VAAHRIADLISGVCPTREYKPRSRYILDTLDAGLLMEGPLEQGCDQPPPNAHVVSSRLWHLTKKLLGRYLTWKVRSGAPFDDLLARPDEEADPTWRTQVPWSAS
jgi:hypothetical protein